ncbi:slr1601 family putative cell division protein [Myxosarcina sp. GI1(2024)]
MNRNRQSTTKIPRPSQKKRSPYRGVTAEVWLKLILSWVIAIASIASLIKLLPYHFSQQAKLEELRTQVGQTEARVRELRHQLNHNFDPQQTQSLMEQYSSLLAPNRSRIYWLPKEKVDRKR